MEFFTGTATLTPGRITITADDHSETHHQATTCTDIVDALRDTLFGVFYGYEPAEADGVVTVKVVRRHPAR